MPKPPSNAKILKELTSQLKTLQTELTVANKAEGIDSYIDVKLKETQARFKKLVVKDTDDKAFGEFLRKLILPPKQQTSSFQSPSPLAKNPPASSTKLSAPLKVVLPPPTSNAGARA